MYPLAYEVCTNHMDCVSEKFVGEIRLLQRERDACRGRMFVPDTPQTPSSIDGVLYDLPFRGLTTCETDTGDSAPQTAVNRSWTGLTRDTTRPLPPLFSSTHLCSPTAYATPGFRCTTRSRIFLFSINVERWYVIGDFSSARGSACSLLRAGSNPLYTWYAYTRGWICAERS